jgi:hypothetical protein
VYSKLIILPLIDDRVLSSRDRTVLQFLATRLRTHFSRQTYNDLRHGVFEPLDIPSEFIAWRRLRILSGLETHVYDCCVHSCCCFLGKYKDLDACPFCKESRFTRAGKPRRLFYYSPLIPQLQGLFQSAAATELLRHRFRDETRTRQERAARAARAQAGGPAEPDVVHDTFDSKAFRTLRETPLHPGGDYHFFDNPDDLALGLSTDGFTLFKRRRRGHSTAWPILIIIYNLHPRIRTRLENVICLGVIPGPKQCKDLNSFLVPLLEELKRLEAGVDTSRPSGDPEASFVLRAFLIMLFGDIPAIAKLLMMKGHNAIMPCRACYIQGVLCQLARNSVYYVPLTYPGDVEPSSADDLILRTHGLFLAHLNDLDVAPTKAARAKIALDTGINSRSIFADLKSINLATCAPYDIMHLFFENLVPNMIRHWTGELISFPLC